MITVQLITEVPPTRTEGSERMINDLEHALAGELRLRTHRVSMSALSRWRDPTSRKQEPVDLVHYFPIGSLSPGALIRGFLWRRSFQAPLVLHAFQYPSRAMLPGAAMRRLLGKKGVVVSPSFALTRELVARRVESYFVPAAVDVSHFRPPSPEERAAARAALQLNPGEIVLLHVGHVRANRNLGGLAELARAGHRVLMVVSPRMPVERNVATELKDAGVTLLEGARPDLRRVYWAADVYVFPVVDIRSAVGVPLSVLEALACGVPVISTSFDGLPAALGRSWPGLVWAEEFADLGKAIKKTLTRQEPAASIGAAAARRFQPSSIVKEYIAIYHRVLGIHG